MRHNWKAKAPTQFAQGTVVADVELVDKGKRKFIDGKIWLLQTYVWLYD